jgi:serine/threonine-protein kinase RsbW
MRDRLVAGNGHEAADPANGLQLESVGRHDGAIRGARGVPSLNLCAQYVTYSAPMGAEQSGVRLRVPSSFALLDLVQSVGDRVSSLAGLDEDATHWVSVAVRESVINAIKHGNQVDDRKHVTVAFSLRPSAAPEALVVEVEDEGAGFDPDAIANPLEPENVLKASGRGIFFMRNFMDEVHISRAPAGGTVVRMIKRLG